MYTKFFNGNAIKSLYYGVREFSFFCLGVREQKKVGNCWFNGLKLTQNKLILKQITFPDVFWSFERMFRGFSISVSQIATSCFIMRGVKFSE